MIKNTLFFLLLTITFGCQDTLKSTRNTTVVIPAENTMLRPQTPIMGWSSWNHFHVNINENIIKAQADFMVSTGMHEAGYNYINIDDGFFGGRDAKGNLIPHPTRFPNGMKVVSDYIHSKGLKAGIYSDAGINTCASYWDKDTIGSGMGLYGHEVRDLTLMLKDWNYDFIKVDWCGGDWLGLDEQTSYTHIINLVRKIRPDVVFNICRWQFPGNWAVPIADSWRISGDIANRITRSMELIVISVVASLIIAIPLGTTAALRANRLTDFALSSIAMLGLSIPGFVIGTIFVLVFGLVLKMLPQTQYVSFADDPIAHMKLLILPSATLAIGNAAVILRMMRSSMLEVLRQDYVRTARAKGLAEGAVIRRHTVRNAINPVVSIVGLECSTLLGGMVIVEQIFNWPGLSSLLLSGVLSRDYPVVQGVVLIIAVVTIVINVIVDILYGVLDPRIRLS